MQGKDDGPGNLRGARPVFVVEGIGCRKIAALPLANLWVVV